ncbi:MAG TPA: molybdenum cofactor biosynthesis protein MoaE [Methanoregulaceae archaeon]|nr:molybdenum cofactor biosynthesis protein MoaE [Methanoregulaceae archaeon]
MIRIQHEPIEPCNLIKSAGTPGAGAIVTFIGTVRDDHIESIELETYQQAAEKDLEEIKDEAMKKFPLLSADIVHRIGRMDIGDVIVLIVVSAGHRKEAFQGCEYIIDRLKQTTPIWKKEYRKDGSRWVEGEHRQPQK